MSRFDADITGPTAQDFERYRLRTELRLRRAALEVTDRASKGALNEIRIAMRAARLGSTGQALGQGSDKKSGRGVHITAEGFSASGNVHVRTKSERTLGVIESYTRGAEITPKKGLWLWFPTEEIQRVAGRGRNRQRVTPGNWKSSGMEAKVGPLQIIESVDGNPLLVVRDATVSAAGLPRSARARTKTGRVRRGYREKNIIVAFVGIPRTSRAGRLNIDDIMDQWRRSLPSMFFDELEGGLT